MMCIMKEVKYILAWLIGINTLLIDAQTLSGNFASMAGEWVRFGTFQGIQSPVLDSARIDVNGAFSFTFKTDKPAIGYLVTAENKPYFLILDKNEKIQLKGERLTLTEGVTVLEGRQNQAFGIYAAEHPRREQALSAWGFLEKIYSRDSLFSVQKTPSVAIQTEKARIAREDQDFIAKLPFEWYLRWYLPIRRLVSDVSTIAQYRTEEIPKTISTFRKMDYCDERLFRSGLLKDAIESHFWLLENSGGSLDIVYREMKISIDSMLLHLVKNESRLNEVTDYLFDLLERHSLFQASEYLALKVLNESSCTLNSDLAKQLETYRAMKKGNIAPDIEFKVNVRNSQTNIKKLSDIKSKYTLVVFGAGWCETCKDELPKISNLYPKWKAKGLEVVFISLDETKEAFERFSQPFPFISYCDYGKWNGPVVTSYFVFGTPTLFLLDAKREIVLRPVSVTQMDTWVDWYLK